MRKLKVGVVLHHAYEKLALSKKGVWIYIEDIHWFVVRNVF